MTILPYVCNCIMGFSNRLKAFKLTNGCSSSYECYSLLQLLFGTPGSEILNMRVRRICCLNNVGTMPLNSRKQLWKENDAPFPWQHNSPKRKGGNEIVNPRQADKKSGGPQGERGLDFSRRKKRQTFFSLYIPYDYITIIYPA